MENVTRIHRIKMSRIIAGYQIFLDWYVGREDGRRNWSPHCRQEPKGRQRTTCAKGKGAHNGVSWSFKNLVEALDTHYKFTCTPISLAPCRQEVILCSHNTVVSRSSPTRPLLTIRIVLVRYRGIIFDRTATIQGPLQASMRNVEQEVHR